MGNEEVPLVSVIVTTRNEEKNIEQCLESITAQTYLQDRIEIIIVDNNSEDKTKLIAAKFTDKVFNKGPERSPQRNFGAEKAAGKYLLYLDADMSLAEKVVADCVAVMERDKDIIGLYISEVVRGDNFWSKVRRFERSFYDTTVIDAVRFIKKDKFLEIGGFDISLISAEDWDLDKRIKKTGKTGFVKTPIYHNEESFNLKSYFSKKSYYIKHIDEYINKWGSDDKDVEKQTGFFYRYFQVFCERGKWKKLIQHPILTLSMYFLRFIIGLSFIFKR